MTTDNADPGHDDGSGSTSSNAGYDDNSTLQPTVGFDYAAVEQNPADKLTPEERAQLRDEIRREFQADELDRTIEGITKLMTWVYQGGAKNLNGVAIRAIALCWVVLPNLRNLNQTAMAGKFGLEKESLGRWVAGDKSADKRVMEGQPLKEAFPELKISHLKFE